MDDVGIEVPLDRAPVKSVGFISLPVPNVAASAAFFTDVLGLKAMPGGTPEHPAFLLTDGSVLALFTGPLHNGVTGFAVDDLDAWSSHLEVSGYPLDGPCFESDSYVWQHFTGPDGLRMELIAARVPTGDR